MGLYKNRCKGLDPSRVSTDDKKKRMGTLDHTKKGAMLGIMKHACTKATWDEGSRREGDWGRLNEMAGWI